MIFNILKIVFAHKTTNHDQLVQNIYLLSIYKYLNTPAIQLRFKHVIIVITLQRSESRLSGTRNRKLYILHISV